MKSIFAYILSILSIPVAYAQQYSTSFENNSTSNVISIVIEAGEIYVEGYSGNEILISADGFEPPPEKAKGLTPLYANGRSDNSGIGLSVSREAGKMQVVSVGHQEIDYHFKIPDQSSIQLQAGPRNDDISIHKMKGEIEVKAHSDDVEILGAGGPVVANSISGNLHIDFDQLNTTKPIAISVVSGDVDMFLPADAKANLKLSSISGEVYTDFDIQLEGGHKVEQDIGRRKPIQATINGGGVPIQISTISGNIYLRKK